jgi:hypothetical protein
MKWPEILFETLMPCLAGRHHERKLELQPLSRLQSLCVSGTACNLRHILFGLKFAGHVMVIQQAEADVSIGVLNIQIQVQHHMVSKYLAKRCK